MEVMADHTAEMGVPPWTPAQSSTATSGDMDIMSQFVTPEVSENLSNEKDPSTPQKESGGKKKQGRVGSKRKLFQLQTNHPSNKVKKVSSSQANKPRRPSVPSGTPSLTPKPTDGSWVPNYPLTERQQLQYLLEVTAKEAQQDQVSECDESQGSPFMRLRRKEANIKRESNAVRVTKRNERGETALHLAAIKGDIDEVKSLIRSGANVNVKDYAGWSPLHESCNFGHINIVEELIKGGASVNTPGYEDITPLHDAVINNHVQVVELLLKYGADPQMTTVQEYTPIDLARSASILELLQGGATYDPQASSALDQSEINSSGNIESQNIESQNIESQNDSDDNDVFDSDMNQEKNGSIQPCSPLQRDDMDRETGSEVGNQITSQESPGSDSQLRVNESSIGEQQFERRRSYHSSVEEDAVDEDVDPQKLNACLDKAMIEISTYLQVDGKGASLMSSPVDTVSHTFYSSKSLSLTNSSSVNDATKVSSKELTIHETERDIENGSHDQNNNTDNEGRNMEDTIPDRDNKGNSVNDKDKVISSRTRQDFKNKENLTPAAKSGWMRRRRASVKVSSSRSECEQGREGGECVGHISNPTWRRDVMRHRYSMRELPLNVPGYQDFLINKKGYNITQLVSKSAAAEKRESQESDTKLGKLKTTHQVEQEKLRLSLEQELVRLFGNFARSLVHRDATPYSVCTVLKSQMVTQGRQVLKSARNEPMKYPSAQAIRQDVEALLAKFEEMKCKLLRRQSHEFDAAVALISLTEGEALNQDLQRDNEIDAVQDFELIPAAFREYYEDFLCVID